MFRECSGNVQGMFRECSCRFYNAYCTWLRVQLQRHMYPTGNFLYDDGLIIGLYNVHRLLVAMIIVVLGAVGGMSGRPPCAVRVCTEKGLGRKVMCIVCPPAIVYFTTDCRSCYR